jgi:hypothetical protein
MDYRTYVSSPFPVPSIYPNLRIRRETSSAGNWQTTLISNCLVVRNEGAHAGTDLETEPSAL